MITLPFRSTTSAKALALLALVPCAFASTNALTNTVANWTFSQSAGPIVNTQVSDDQNDPATNSATKNSRNNPRNNGWTGYSPDSDDDNEVDRNGSHARFNGQRNSIVLIDDANHTDFNPGYDSLVVTAQFAINRSALNEEALGFNQTWNLVQKGRFNNAGGQWKLQIRKNHSGRIFLQCLVNDDKPDTRRVAAQIPLKKAWLNDEQTLEGSCTLNRKTNELSAELTNTTQNINVPAITKALTEDFGAVAPQAGMCGSPEAFGGNVAIGNKPLCPDQKLDTNDAFRGKVHSVLIQRF